MVKKLMKKYLKNQRGLTLIELLAVIVILGIIAAIAVPSIGGIIEKQRVKASKANAIMILDAARLYYLDNPSATSMADKTAVTNALVTGNYLEALPKDPAGTDYSAVSITKNATTGELSITLDSSTNAYDVSGTKASINVN